MGTREKSGEVRNGWYLYSHKVVANSGTESDLESKFLNIIH